MTPQEKTEALRKNAADYLLRNGIVLTEVEKQRIEIADFGLGMFETFGLRLFVYVNTERVCAKELILLPNQTCPEHRHPAFGGAQGKEETFRCRAGRVYLYVPGEPTESPACAPPEEHRKYFTAQREIILNPGGQYTLYPDTPHWFCAGNEGALVTEFSTRNADENDIFTYPRVVRV